MNDIDICLEVVLRSRQPLSLCRIRRWISRKSLEIARLGSKGNGLRRVEWMSRDPERRKVKVVTPMPMRLELNILKTAGDAI